jgi:hypothetical protein
LDLPSGHQRFLGLLPTWSSRVRHNEAEDLVPECIDVDAVIKALWEARVDDLMATSSAAQPDEAADPHEWVLHVNIGHRGINQRCVEASDSPLFRRALNSAWQLGLDRDDDFGDWILPCRYSRETPRATRVQSLAMRPASQAAVLPSIRNLPEIAEHPTSVLALPPGFPPNSPEPCQAGGRFWTLSLPPWAAATRHELFVQQMLSV